MFDTLLYLVEHAGETLDKDVLLRSIWPGVIVEENSLTRTSRPCVRCWVKRAARIATSPRSLARAIASSQRSRSEMVAPNEALPRVRPAARSERIR